MFAPPDCDVRRPEISGIPTDPVQRNPMETQNVRNAKLEGIVRMSEVVDKLNNGIELPQAVPSFSVC